eukprot:gene7722-biopygen1526
MHHTQLGTSRRWRGVPPRPAAQRPVPRTAGRREQAFGASVGRPRAGRSGGGGGGGLLFLFPKVGARALAKSGPRAAMRTAARARPRRANDTVGRGE